MPCIMKKVLKIYKNEKLSYYKYRIVTTNTEYAT